MIELLDKRTFTQKQFNLNAGRYRMEAHIGHIHYRDGALKNGSFSNIDTTLNYNPLTQKFQMTNASYEAEIGLMGSVRFHNINHSISFELDNPSSVQATAYNGSKFGELGKGLIWNNILGNGGHQIVEVRNGSLAKIFRFDSKPASNVITFKVSFSGNIKLLRDNIEIKPLLQEIRTTGILNVECDGLLSWLRPPKAWNHRGERVNLELRWYRVGAVLYIDKIIPQSFIDSTFTEQGAWLECDTVTSYWTGSGDGTIGYADSSWTTVRNGNPNPNYHNAETTSADNSIRAYFNTDYMIMRGFYPVNTEGLLGSIITSATFKVCASGNYANTGRSFALIQTTQSDPTTLLRSEYTAFTLDSPQEGATRVTGAFTSGTYFQFGLNSSGLSWIVKNGWTKLGIREGNKDVDNVTPTDFVYTYMYFSEQSGTNQDPYLEINHLKELPQQFHSHLAMIVENGLATTERVL